MKASLAEKINQTKSLAQVVAKAMTNNHLPHH